MSRGPVVEPGVMRAIWTLLDSTADGPRVIDALHSLGQDIKLVAGLDVLRGVSLALHVALEPDDTRQTLLGVAWSELLA